MSDKQNSPIIIIAEAGVNHNGDIELAKKLIKKAHLAKADFVKFQTFSAENLTTQEGVLAEYQKKEVGNYSNQFEMLKSLELTKENHIELIRYCRELGINFLSTPFDEGSLNFLIDLGCDLIKVPSGDLTNYFMLSAVAEKGLPVILSTGMGTEKEVGEALECMNAKGLEVDKITLLHCTTEYPCPLTDVNLRAMHTLKEKFNTKVGYSDHTAGISVSIAAAALGASVIEKHFTLDKNMVGPDHKASLEPEELLNMVKGIRDVEQCMGDGIKIPSQSELKNIKIARKSIVAKTKIKLGDYYTKENLTAKRPGDGISPMMAPILIGSQATQDFKQNEKIISNKSFKKN